VTAGLLLLWGAFFARQLIWNGMPFRRDTLLLYLPIRQFIRDSLFVALRSAWQDFAHFQLSTLVPGWYPYEGIGVPFVGQIITATFHPETWLLLPLPPAFALKVNILLAYLLALGGGYRFARALRTSRPAAASGGAAIAFSGYALSMSDNLPFLMGLATLPWVGWAAVRVVTGGTPRHIAALAIAWALILLGGDAQSFVLASLVVVACLAATRVSVGTVAAAVIAGGLAGACCAIEWLPATAVFQESSRMQTGLIVDPGTFWAFHPWRFLELITPHFLPADGRLAASQLLFGQKFRWAADVFAGSIVLVLAAAGTTRRRRISVTFATLAVLAIWLATGSRGHLLPLTWSAVPLLQSFRFPEKYLALFEVALVPLVAIGVDVVLQEPRRWSIRFLGPAIAVLWAGLAFRSEAITAQLLPAESVGVTDFAQTIGETWSNGLLATAGYLAILGGLLWIMARRQGVWLVIPMLLAAELWHGNRQVLPVVAPDLVDPESAPLARAVAAAAQPDHPPTRLISTAHARFDTNDGGTSDADWARATLNMLRPDVAGLIHASTIGASAFPGQTERTQALFGPLGTRAASMGPLFGACLQVVDDPERKYGPEVVRARDSEDGLVLVRIGCRPPVYPASVHPLGDAMLVDAVTALKPDEAIWDGGLGPMPDAHEITWHHYAPGLLDFDAESSTQTGLIVSEAQAAGWQAELDGQPAKIRSANGIAMALELPPGKHHVKFVYWTPRLGEGALATAIGLLLCFLLSRWRGIAPQYGRRVESFVFPPDLGPIARERRRQGLR
jgi:hypothetical protein